MTDIMSDKERREITATLRPFAYTKTALIGCPHCGQTPVQSSARNGVRLMCTTPGAHEMVTPRLRTIGAAEKAWLWLVAAAVTSMPKPQSWHDMKAQNG